MGERFEHQGMIYEDLGDGNVRVIGPANSAQPQPMVVGTPRAPDRDIRTVGDTVISIDPNSGGVTPLYSAPEGRDSKAETEGNAQQQMRRANLDALIGQINEVQRLFNEGPGRTSGVGAITDYLPSGTNRAFDAAGAGLVEQALGAFRVPGIGGQSDADAARLERAYGIEASNFDAVNQQRLDQLRARVDETRASMGLPAASWEGLPGQRANADVPSIRVGLPSARLGRTDPAPNAPTGVTDAGGPGGMRVVPELYGMGDDVASLVGQGASEEQVMGYIRQRIGGVPNLSLDPEAHRETVRYLVAAHRQNPQAPVKSLATDWEQMHMVPTEDQGGTVLGSIADSPFGAAAISAGNAVSAGGLAALGDENARAVLDFSRNERPGFSFAGDVAGSALAMSGVGGIASRLSGLPSRLMTGAGGVGGDMTYGAVRGFNESGGDPMMALVGAGAAGGGNLVGRGITSGVGRVTRGVSDPAVRYLTDRGIRLTPGQILGQGGMFGRGIRGFENALESIPVLGQTIAQRRQDGVEDYFRARVQDVLGPVGAQAQGNTAQELLENARTSIGDAYNVLDGRTFQLDPPAINAMQAAMQTGRTIPRVGEEFGAIMDRNVAPLFSPSGAITGRQFQDAMQQLRGASASLRRDDTMGVMAAESVDDIEGALTDMVRRQAPDVMPRLDAANRSYSGLVPLQDAAITAIAPSPAQVTRAALSNTRRYGGRARASERDYLGTELDGQAQAVMPSIIGNSGTADRGLAAFALPTALGGAAIGLETFSNNPGLTAALLAIGGLSTRRGSAAAQRALVSRPDAMRRAGAAIQAQSRRGGMFGAGAGTYFLPSASMGLYQP